MKQMLHGRLRLLSLMFCALVILTLSGLQPASAKCKKKMNGEFISTFMDMLDPPLRPCQEPLPYGSGMGEDDYAYLGMVEGAPEIWEDGLRTDPNSFSFEWWYYDAHFSDGSSVVVVYYTKSMFTPGAPQMPIVSITIVTPTGEVVAKDYFTAPEEDTFSAAGCDVKIGSSYTTGDLNNYVIHAEIDDVVVHLNMQGLVPSWRPGHGHLFFEDYDTYFAWIPAIPSGVTVGSLTYGGETHNVVGSGYHDHNWGNSRIFDHLKYWWWSRSQVGPYTVITANQRMKNKYGNDSWSPVFVVLDENGALIDANLDAVTMTHTESNFQDHPDPAFEGQIANTVTFRAENENGDWAEIRLDAQMLLASKDLMPNISLGMTDIEIFIAELLGRDPWYTRFGCAAELMFNIGGVEYHGSGFLTLELMDLE